MEICTKNKQKTDNAAYLSYCSVELKLFVFNLNFFRLLLELTFVIYFMSEINISVKKSDSICTFIIIVCNRKKCIIYLVGNNLQNWQKQKLCSIYIYSRKIHYLEFASSIEFLQAVHSLLPMNNRCHSLPLLKT